MISHYRILIWIITASLGLFSNAASFASAICDAGTSLVREEYNQFSNDTRLICVYQLPRGDSNIRASVTCPDGSNFIHGGYSISNSPYRVDVQSKDLSELPNTRWKHSVRFGRDPANVGSPVEVQVSAVCSGLHEPPPEEDKSLLSCNLSTKGKFTKQYGDIPIDSPINANFRFTVDLSKDLYEPNTVGFYDTIEGAENKVTVNLPSYTSKPRDGSAPKEIPEKNYIKNIRQLRIFLSNGAVVVEPFGIMDKLGGLEQPIEQSLYAHFFIDKELHNVDKIPSSADAWKSSEQTYRDGLSFVNQDNSAAIQNITQFDQITAHCM